jgi:hypothetical protein
MLFNECDRLTIQFVVDSVDNNLKLHLWQ